MAALLEHYEADAATILTAKTLADLMAGATGTPQKFAVRNAGDRVLGPTLQGAIAGIVGNDGASRFRLKLDVATLSSPWGLAATLIAGGGSWAAAGSKGYVVTAVNAAGETVASLERVITVGAVTERVSLAWQPVPGATSYKLYRTDTPGSYPGPALVPGGPGSALAFVDTGAAVGAGAPPVANTTGGAAPGYGTPPGDLNSSTAPILPGSTPGILAIGEWAFYWINRVVPSNSLEAGNARSCQVLFSET